MKAIPSFKHHGRRTVDGPTGERTAKTVATPDGLLAVDYSATGRAVGIEIAAPRAVPLERLNQLLADLGEAPLAALGYTPFRAA